MKRLIIITGIIILFLIPSLDSIQANIKNDNQIITISSEQYNKGYRYNTQGWIYIHIEGKPYERGFQHGYLLANEIVDHIKRMIYIFPQKLSWHIARFNANRLFWNKYPDEYQQEIKGIADGCAERGGKIYGKPVSYKDILTLNEMYELRSRFRNSNIYPLRLKHNWFYNKLKGIIKHLFNIKSTDLNIEESANKCSAFIATGDRTTDGQIVAAHNTRSLASNSQWYHMFITERWNVMLDISPSKGYRFLMSTAPGMIFSDEDYYQNEAGMILMETTLEPQAVFRRLGDPLVVRARKAIQYSDNIDKMVDFFIKKNNGLFANEWLMGDTKTGEIASLELSAFNHALKRTKNGFYSSVNKPRDDKVRWELNSFGLGIIGRIIAKEYKPSKRDISFEEFEEEYYGKIDVNLARKIMSTYPINEFLEKKTMMFDCKVTNSNLVKDFGIWTFMGNPGGGDFPAKDYPLYTNRKEYTDLPSCGWIQLYCIDESSIFRGNNQKSTNDESSEIIWEFKTDEGEIGNAIYSSPVSDEEKIYITSWNGNIYAIEIESGKKIWETNIGWSSESTPLIVEDKIIVGSSDGLFLLDKDNGKIIWKKEFRAISTKPAFYDNVVYTGSHDGNVYAIDIETSDILWKFETEGEIHSSPIVYENSLYFGSNDGYLYNIDLKNGLSIWEYKTGNAIISSPIIYKNSIYFGSWDSNLYSLDIKDGKLNWKFTTGWGVDSSPSIRENTIFFGSQDNNFYALDANNGNLKWIYPTNAGIKSSPAVYGDFTFFGSSDGKIYAINSSTGKLEWSLAPDYYIEGIYNYITKPIVSSPYTDDGMIFVGSVNGNIYCLNAKTFERPSEQIKEVINIPLETWFFMIISLLFVVIVTGVTLYFSRRKN